MNKKQYNNVIENTLKHEQSAQTEDSLSTARAIFDNMGVALPQGDIKTVYDTIKTDNYMGWKSCTMQEAQAAADNGTAAIGISEDRIVVLAATVEEDPVEETVSVMSLDENTSAFSVAGLEYYSYSYGTTGGSTTGSGGSIPTIYRSLYGSIEYNGEIYDIFVPNHLDTSIGAVWNTVAIETKMDYTFDGWKFLAGLSFPNQDGGINAANGNFRNDISRSVICRPEMNSKIGFLSIFIGALNAASTSYNNIFLKFIFQKTSDNGRRVIIEAGSSSALQTFNSLSSDIPISAYYNNAGFPLVQAGIMNAVGNLYEEVTGNTKEPLATYDCEITIDSRHKNDGGAVSYLWIDMYGNIKETPIIYHKDKVSFGVQHGIFGIGEFESFYNPYLLGSIAVKEEFQKLFNEYLLK